MMYDNDDYDDGGSVGNVDDDVDVVIQPLQSWTSALQKNTHNSAV